MMFAYCTYTYVHVKYYICHVYILQYDSVAYVYNFGFHFFLFYNYIWVAGLPFYVLS